MEAYAEPEQMARGRIYDILTQRMVEVDLVPHPTPVVETVNLQAEKAPKNEYVPRLTKAMLESGALSALQFEAVACAGFRHSQRVANAEGLGTQRAGFFLGDATGVGKGRTIAAIITDNHFRGRKRALWVSCSRSLLEDARAAFDNLGIGADVIPVYELGGKGLPRGKIKVDSGVIFATYSSLIGRGADGRWRMYEIAEWLRGDAEHGVIVFDECHRAKNLICTTKSSKSAKAAVRSTKVKGKGKSPRGGGTLTGRAVRDIQMELPRARVVYASATGMSSPNGIAPFLRLNLWGEYAAFENFQEFAVQVRGGRRSDSTSVTSRMELAAREFKAEGAYVSRSLSFVGTEFKTTYVPLHAKDRVIYDTAVQWWCDVLAFIEENEMVFKELDGQGAEDSDDSDDEKTVDPRRIVRAVYWGTHQRFFKLLQLSCKMDYIVDACKRAVREGLSPVVALWSTGDAGVKDEMSRMEVTALLSSTRAMGRNILIKHLSPLPEHNCQRVDINNCSELYRYKWAELMRRINTMDLPIGPLDELIERLGGPDKVAELSGRSHRLTFDDGAMPGRPEAKGRHRKAAGLCGIVAATEHGPDVQVDEINEIAGAEGPGKRYIRRNAGLACGNKVSDINNAEKELFQSGEKVIAVITGAASSGISLHASDKVRNQRRRVMFVAELSWSADVTIQQFGRTHRSNQVHAPLYELVVSDLGGESRFVSAVTQRLQMLGALTKADANAALGSGGRGETEFVTKSYFDKWGNLAAREFISYVLKESKEAPIPPCVVMPEAVKAAQKLFLERGLPPEAVESIVEYGTYLKEEFFEQARQAFYNIGVMDVKHVMNAGQPVVTLFNKLLGVPVTLQNQLFAYFDNLYSDRVWIAKSRGEHDRSTIVETAARITRHPDFPQTEVLHKSLQGVKTCLSHYLLDHGISFEEAMLTLRGAALRNKRLRNDGVHLQEYLGAFDGFYEYTATTDDKRLLRREVFLLVEKPNIYANPPRKVFWTKRHFDVYVPHRGFIKVQEHRRIKRMAIGTSYKNVLDTSDRPGDKACLKAIFKSPEHTLADLLSARSKKVWRRCNGERELEAVERMWDAQYTQALVACAECPDCRSMRSNAGCVNGPARLEHLPLLHGRVLQVFDVISEVIGIKAGEEQGEQEDSEWSEEAERLEAEAEEEAAMPWRHKRKGKTPGKGRRPKKRAVGFNQPGADDDADDDEPAGRDLRKEGFDVRRLTVTHPTSEEEENGDYSEVGKSFVGIKVASNKVDELRTRLSQADPNPAVRRQQRLLLANERAAAAAAYRFDPRAAAAAVAAAARVGVKDEPSVPASARVKNEPKLPVPAVKSAFDTARAFVKNEPTPGVPAVKNEHKLPAAAVKDEPSVPASARVKKELKLPAAAVKKEHNLPAAAVKKEPAATRRLTRSMRSRGISEAPPVAVDRPPPAAAAPAPSAGTALAPAGDAASPTQAPATPTPSGVSAPDAFSPTGTPAKGTSGSVGFPSHTAKAAPVTPEAANMYDSDDSDMDILSFDLGSARKSKV